MQVPCPSCGRLAEQHSQPIRGPSSDGSELWVCLWCPMVVCDHPVFTGPEASVPCYMAHTASSHPEAYKPRPTGGRQKNSKGKKR